MAINFIAPSCKPKMQSLYSICEAIHEAQTEIIIQFGTVTPAQPPVHIQTTLLILEAIC